MILSSDLGQRHIRLHDNMPPIVVSKIQRSRTSSPPLKAKDCHIAKTNPNTHPPITQGWNEHPTVSEVQRKHLIACSPAT